MDIKKDYKVLQDHYEDFLSEVKQIIVKGLKQENIPVAFEISGRLKTIESIEEKNLRKKESIENSITDLDDLVGIRIVLLFPDYKKLVVKFLEDNFKVVKKIDSIVNPDKFGYSSEHLILGVKDEWAAAPNWKNHQEKRIEIQVRTLAEHVWAESSHSLFYKRDENMPNAMKRDMSRLSALLEIVDDNMQTIKTKVVAHFEYINKCDYNEILEMDLFPETLRRVMLQHSNGRYDLNEQDNKTLSSKIESEYNILTVKVIDEIITASQIKTDWTGTDEFIAIVMTFLEKAYKEQRDKALANEELGKDSK